jgi:hypothetical protein
MSTFVDLLPQEMPGTMGESRAVAGWHAEASAKSAPWSQESFVGEQIRGLIRQLFSPSPTPLRQVVFSAVDFQTEVMPICLQVGNALGLHASGSVCVVDAIPREQQFEIVAGGRSTPSSSAKHFGALRDSSEQISARVWFMPSDVFWEDAHDFSADWLPCRLAELRLEFDYTLLAGPAAAHGEAAALGNLSDGLVLVLRANFTRRITAQKAKERLSSANTRLLGTILTERVFPIPEAIYKRV